MTTFFSFLKQHKLPPRETLSSLLNSPLSWASAALYALGGLTIIFLYWFLVAVNNHFLVPIPARGGVITEGVIGAPQFINPLLASTETDVGLVKLLYSGLVSSTADGSVTPVLATRYDVSPNNTVYTFTLRPNLKWSDGKPLTTEDIAFTFEKLKDSNFNRTSAHYWQSITVATTPTTVTFTLPSPDTTFLSHATIGILPKHIWVAVPAESFESDVHNLRPVGSGPFAFVSLDTQSEVPTQITLKRNTHYPIRKPYIDELSVVFFANQESLLAGLENGDIDTTLDATPQTAATLAKNNNFTIANIPNPKAVFIAHLKKDPMFSNQAMLSLITESIDRARITDTVVHGYGLPAGTPTYTQPVSTPDTTIQSLQSIGYTYRDGVLSQKGSPVGFSLAVENQPDLLEAAQLFAQELGTIGITVVVKAFDPGTFKQEMSAQTYGMVLVHSTELTPSYTPLITLYTEAYPFITKRNIFTPIPSYLPESRDRYDTVTDWHTRVNRVWKFFTRNTDTLEIK